MTTPILWHLQVSHYNEKARWALDYKQVPHVRRAIFPGLQEFRARRLGAGKTSPILQLEDGAVGDSTRIIEEIERRWPDPPLYPADPEERRRALELEDFFDEHLGPQIRRVLFAMQMSEPGKFVTFLNGPDHPRIGLLKALSPVLSPVVRKQFEINPQKVEESKQDVRAALDRVEAEAGPSGYLVGDSFSVADLTAAALLMPVVQPPEFPYPKLPLDQWPAAAHEWRDSLKDRPGFQWVLDMYARHRGTSAEVSAAA